MLERRAFLAPWQEEIFSNDHNLSRPNKMRLLVGNYYANLASDLDDRVKRLKEFNKNRRSVEEKRQYYRDESINLRLKRTKLKVTDFLFLKPALGKGGFGEVYLVKKKDTNELFAMKIQEKNRIIEDQNINSARTERDILVTYDSDWIVKLFYSFQDNSFLYLVMELMLGGTLDDLFDRLRNYQITEKQVAFYMAEIAMALDIIHQKSFFHRDLKPANILIDERGHLKLSDFGCSKGSLDRHGIELYQKKETAKEDIEYIKKLNETIDQNKKNIKDLRGNYFVGTYRYAAPEILACRKQFNQKGYIRSYDYRSDWYSYGIIMFEFLFKRLPYNDNVMKVAIEKNFNLTLTQTIPYFSISNFSQSTKDLMERLINFKVEKRLASLNELKSHPFFYRFNWSTLRAVEAPFPAQKAIIVNDLERNFREINNMNIFDGRKKNADPDLNDWVFLNFTFRRFQPSRKPSIFQDQLLPKR